MKKLTILLVLLCIFSSAVFAQVGINNDNSPADPSAGLDIKYTDKGLLIPRISLVNTTTALPVISPALSLLVYNTATTGDVSPGYYYWSGTAWKRLSASASGSGTANYMTKWTADSTLGNSQLFDDGTNVGIGTTTPGAKLDVAGRIWQTSTGQSVFVGEGAGASDDLSDNQNVFLGYNAGNANTSGMSNVAVGTGSLYNNTTRKNLIAVGDSALFNNGLWASGDYQAIENTAVGAKAMFSNTTGSWNSAFGFEALKSNNGYCNTAIGSHALQSNDGGGYNTAIGNFALYSNINGQYNTANGYQALYLNTIGNENIGIGLNSLYSNIDGNFNTVIGTRADVLSSNLTNATAIGSSAAVNASNSLVLGSIAGVNYATASVNVGIGTTTPSARLDVVGDVKITNGSEGIDKVLTSDANGLASWQNSELTELAASMPASPGTPVIVSTGDEPVSVAVSAGYAYVVNLNSDNMYVYDVSNPASPGSPVISNTGNGPYSVAVSGDYAYVVNLFSDNMYVYDVSNPASPGTPVIVSTGDGPYSVAVSGGYAYVVNGGSNDMYVYDVSNPASPGIPVIVNTGNDPVSVAVSAGYAYVVNLFSDNMYVYDVSNPASPGDPVIVNSGDGPVSVAVSGNYAYVVNLLSDDMYVYDVSNPASPGTPVIVSTGYRPFSVAVSGGYAYVVNAGSDNMYVYDVSNPASPGTPVIVSTGDYPHSVAVSAGYAYVVNLNSDNMYVYDVLTQNQNLVIQNGNVVMVPESWSTSNDNIYNANPGNVGIGTASPLNKLDIEGGAVIGATYSGNNTAPANGLLVQGNMGIGTTTPLMKLHAASSDSAVVLIENTQTLNTNVKTAMYFKTGSGTFPYTGAIKTIGQGSTTARLGFFTYAASSPNGLLERLSIMDNGNVGIGTTSPLKELDVTGEIQATGTGNNYLAGKIGIGTSNPEAQLTVNECTHAEHSDVAVISLANTGIANLLSLVNSNTEFLAGKGVSITFFPRGSSGTAGEIGIIAENSNNSSSGIFFKTYNSVGGFTEKMRIQSDGNVGIGTTSPSAPLHITANATALPSTNGLLVYNPSTNNNNHAIICARVGGPNAGNPYISLDVNSEIGWSMGMDNSDNSLKFSNAWDNLTSATKMTVDTNGNVGIGTTAPLEKLQINGNIRIGQSASDDNQDYFIKSAGQLTIHANNANPQDLSFVGLNLNSGISSNLSCINIAGSANTEWQFIDFKTLNTERMRIDNVGNVGIGTVSPSQRLDVNGNARFRSITSGAYWAPLNITSDGTLTTATSDIRMKTNIEDLDHCLDQVMSLRGVRFNWKEDPDGNKKVGFIAQEMEQILPEVVFTNPTDGLKGINYGEVTSILVEAVQELRAEKDAQIAELILQNQDLKSANEVLKSMMESMQAQIDGINEYLEMSSQK